MKRTTVYELASLYRGPFQIDAFTFGEGSRLRNPEKSIAIIGSMRGDEVQQLYIASQLVRQLKRLEDAGLIHPEAQILVIPCANPFSLNTATRFWAPDSTDINRMFPGYDLGETTQRIAGGIFAALQGFGYGIQLASFYLPGEFVPHVRMMETGNQDTSLVGWFGLPYAIIREPVPVDVGTLNYNWQIWDTKAFSLFPRKTATLDVKAAKTDVFAMLRFMMRAGIITYDLHGGFTTTVVKEDHLVNVPAPTNGIVEHLVNVGDHVEEGQVIAVITDPYTGEASARLESPSEGVIFFDHAEPLISEGELVFRIIDDRVL